jgi:antitoxin (DNA-binding transcriptional repressor) of toxin-antitoxin stability system
LLSGREGKNADKDVFKKAVASGCQWVLVSQIRDHKIKDEKSGYYITLEQSIQPVGKGNIVTLASYGRNSHVIAPLQALSHDGRNMSRDNREWLTALDAAERMKTQESDGRTNERPLSDKGLGGRNRRPLVEVKEELAVDTVKSKKRE